MIIQHLIVTQAESQSWTCVLSSATLHKVVLQLDQAALFRNVLYPKSDKEREAPVRQGVLRFAPSSESHTVMNSGVLQHGNCSVKPHSITKALLADALRRTIGPAPCQGSPHLPTRLNAIIQGPVLVP